MVNSSKSNRITPPPPGGSRSGAAQSGTRSSFILGIQLSDGAMSGIVFSKESFRAESRPPLAAGSSLSLGEARYIPRLGFSLQDALMDGRTPRPSGIHPSPSIWTDGREEGGGEALSVFHTWRNLTGQSTLSGSPSLSWPWNRSSWRLCIFIFRRWEFLFPFSFFFGSFLSGISACCLSFSGRGWVVSWKGWRARGSWRDLVAPVECF